MKIAISELDRPEIRNLDSSAGEEIIGGDTSIKLSAEAFADGDITFTKTDRNSWSLKVETEKSRFDFTLSSQFAQFALAASSEAT